MSRHKKPRVLIVDPLKYPTLRVVDRTGVNGRAVVFQIEQRDGTDGLGEERWRHWPTPSVVLGAHEFARQQSLVVALCKRLRARRQRRQA